MLMIQTQLAHGNTQMVAWLPQDSRVKRGSVISLETGGERWTVLKQYTPCDSSTIQRGWGLDLPRSQRTER